MLCAMHNPLWFMHGLMKSTHIHNDFVRYFISKQLNHNCKTCVHITSIVLILSRHMSFLLKGKSIVLFRDKFRAMKYNTNHINISNTIIENKGNRYMRNAAGHVHLN